MWQASRLLDWWRSACQGVDQSRRSHILDRGATLWIFHYLPCMIYILETVVYKQHGVQKVARRLWLVHCHYTEPRWISSYQRRLYVCVLIVLKSIRFFYAEASFPVFRGHRKNMNPKYKRECNQMLNSDGSGLEIDHNEYGMDRYGYGMGVDLNRWYCIVPIIVISM